MDLSNKDIKDMTAVEREQLKKEYDMYQTMFTTHPPRTTPYLPHFSGDGKGCDYGYWRESVKSVQSLKHDNNAILQAIRKSVSGTAAKVIGCLPFSSTVDKIIEGFDVSFGELKNDAANWQMFYNARQQKMESIIDWNVRLRDLWKKAPTVTVPEIEADKIIKAQLWVGLKSTDVKNASRHFNDDKNKMSSDLLLYIRGLEDTTQQQHAKPVLPVASDESTEEVSTLRKELAEMKLMMKQQLTDNSNQNRQHEYNQQPQQVLQQHRPQGYSCFRCGKQGHVMKYCRSFVAQQHQPR